MSEQDGAATQQTLESADVADVSPSEIRRRLNGECDPKWSDDDEFFEPRLMYEEPMWHGKNGWKKWHAERECGAETVYLMEDPLCSSNTPDRFAWKLYCGRCGAVRWDEVIYLNRKWYYDQFESEKLQWQMSSVFDSVWLHQPFVLETGGLPTDKEMRNLIRRSWYETEAQERMAPPMPWEETND